MDTGFTATDAASDFARARRRHLLGRLIERLRGAPRDFDLLLPFEDVLRALGPTDRHPLGVQPIALDTIVGSVDRPDQFDRQFRPTTGLVRERWAHLARLVRAGTELPPIEVYRVGELHFVQDGHHRISVYRALGRTHVDAEVTEVRTRLQACICLTPAHLPLKHHQRLFFERVPLPPEVHERIKPGRAERYAALANEIKAWGFRLMLARGELLTRAEIAAAWYADEYDPVVATLHELSLCADSSDADAYLCVIEQRDRLQRTYRWSDAVWQGLTEAISGREKTV
jgi:hypothetical protein